MTDTRDSTRAPQRDYRDTVFLPKTDFPMKAGLPQKEPGILARWQEIGLYEKLRAARAGRPKFILHDGPPYANGDMHIGHALNHILKDMVCRTQSLLGKDAPYVPGWDCHGLPIEWKVEEQYRAKKRNKDEVPPAEFRAECRAYAQHWVNVQREQLKRLGINGDWDHPYLTMDFTAEATIVSELLKFAESGQLYRGAKPVMWSPVEKTALAEAEVEYEEITSTQIDVAFEIVRCPKLPILEGAYAVIWTTTPWTIPVNQALSYGPTLSYDLLEWNGKRYLVAFGCQAKSMERWGFQPNQGRGRLLGAYSGNMLEGATARHPMANLFRHSRAGGDPLSQTSGVMDHRLRGDDKGGTAEGLNIDPNSPLAEFFLRPRPFLPGDFVTTDAGTGLVHMAPDHGEDDFLLCKAHGIDPVFAVDGAGMYRADWAWLGGQGSVINKKFVAADGPICSDLRGAEALLAASDDFTHTYPHSWRSKAKVIFRATPQWFIPMDAPLAPPLPHAGGAGGGLALSTSESLVESGGPPPTPPACGRGEGATLRQTALAAIDATTWHPPKGRNRITAMVAGRPDWVISRQRAWGVPITLFVHRQTGDYLRDPDVNKRIVYAIRAHGVDAWDATTAQDLLGPDYDLAEYERVTDILDVWFDSGCTHAFVLESGRWPDLRWPADLYLEGSDQHRGWFQSSLLEACGTRGRAPYQAVLTHGFTMDAKGMKMSKSLGNTVNPLDLMKESGADILRLWALSVDFTEDHRIGKEILTGVSDQYRKLRNTFRYLLGALDGFSEAERVDVAEMPELERYILHLLADLDAKLRDAVARYDFNSYTRLLSDFVNDDLSAFYFDIRKDSLYCDVNPATGAQTPKRRAYRTVLDTLFHALVRYAAPVLVFTAEEVWGTRFPDKESVHLLEWPEVDAGWVDETLASEWVILRDLRALCFRAAELARNEKRIGSTLEAIIQISISNSDVRALIDKKLKLNNTLIEEIFISGEVHVLDIFGPITLDSRTSQKIRPFLSSDGKIAVVVLKNDFKKCGRCWRHLPEVTEDGALCARCAEVLA